MDRAKLYVIFFLSIQHFSEYFTENSPPDAEANNSQRLLEFLEKITVNSLLSGDRLSQSARPMAMAVKCICAVHSMYNLTHGQ